MKHEEQIKELLIQNAIHLIAEGGFEKATVKELTTCGGDLPGFKMNDVYIYRLFGSKEALYRATFVRLDSELFYNVRRAYQMVNEDEDPEITLKDRIVKFLEYLWDYILHDEERCRCYLRYYYSIYYNGPSAEAHKELYSGLLTEMTPSFKDDADVPEIIHSVFSSLFAFANRVFNGNLADTPKNRPHVFNVLYSMMSSYFKDAQ